MAKKGKDTKQEGAEIFENPDALVEKYDKVEDFLRKNQTYVYGALAAVVLAVAGYFYWQDQLEEKYMEAEVEIFEAEYVFEGDSAFKAEEDLLYITEEYAGTRTANRAYFELGTIALRKGDPQSAIEYLKEFSSDDYLIQARAYSMLGDAYTDLEDYDEAVEYYQKAIDYKPNQYYTPVYLIKLAMVQEIRDEKEEAIKNYNLVIQKYATAYNEVNLAKKRKALLEATISDK